MKFIKQDENGRIVIDGEGMEIKLHKSIPDSMAVLTNFCFDCRSINDEATDKTPATGS